MRRSEARTHPLGRLDDNMAAAVGNRYDVFPTHRAGRRVSECREGWVAGVPSRGKSGAAALDALDALDLNTWWSCPVVASK